MTPKRALAITFRRKPMQDGLLLVDRAWPGKLRRAETRQRPWAEEGLPPRLAIAAVATATAAAAAITTVTATAAAATAETATTATTTSAILARFGFINRQAASVDFLAVKLSNGGCAFFLAGHFDEAKAA